MGMSRKNRFYDMIISLFYEDVNVIFDNKEELMLL